MLGHKAMLFPALAMAGCYSSYSAHLQEDVVSDSSVHPSDATDAFDSHGPPDAVDSTDHDPPDPTICLVNRTPGASVGEIGLLESDNPEAILLDVFQEGDRLLMVVQDSGICLARLDSGLRVVESTGWDSRFHSDEGWRAVELTNGIGLFSVRGPVRYSSIAPGEEPGSILTTEGYSTSWSEWTAVGASSDGGFLIAWNEEWDIHTAGYSAEGELSSGFHHLTDDGRYPSFVFWRDRSIIGYHGTTDISVVGPYINELTSTGEASSDRFLLGTSAGVRVHGAALDDGLALTWLGYSLGYALLDESLSPIVGPIHMDGGRLQDQDVAGSENTLVAAYTVQETVSSSHYFLRYVEFTDHVPSEIRSIDDVTSPRRIFVETLDGHWYVFWQVWSDIGIHFMRVI